jgi:hypothetical protein
VSGVPPARAPRGTPNLASLVLRTPSRRPSSAAEHAGFIHERRGRGQPVEKLLHVPFRAPFADSTPRYCSVLVVVSRLLDPIWRTDWLDHDFFNRLGYSAKFAVTAFSENRTAR